MSALEKQGGVGALLGQGAGPQPDDLPPEPPPGFLSAEAVEHFTDLKGSVREFNAGVADKTRALLSGRSAVRVMAGPLSELGAVWRVVPLQDNAPNAEGIVASAEWALGSLTLPLLSIGRDVPMLLVTGGRHLEGLAQDGGHFAILSRPLPVEVTPPPPSPKVETRPKSEPKTDVKNGAAKKAPETAAVLIETKEEGIH